ncbi:MAG: P1 family peptidase [Longimicrobiales bacterium]
MRRTNVPARTGRTPGTTVVFALASLLALVPASCASQALPDRTLPPAGDPSGGITEVSGVTVGHHTLEGAPTGCTVILAEGGATAGGDVRGGAPGTVETDLLDPVNSVDFVNAVLLSGGSAFGLSARDGVMRFLDERGVGYPVGQGQVVPIVTGAIIFDLGVGRPGVRPGPDCGYQAATEAGRSRPAEGSVGAGAGATVGKLRGMDHAMKGGVGTASISLEGGLIVGALVVVNAVGDVIDPATGAVVAGARGEGDELLDARRLLRGEAPSDDAGANTTIGVVATNARLTKAEVNKVAQMAQDGLARALFPSHTPSDGDTMFSLATGELEDGYTVSQVGALAADAVADAILRAVTQATGLPGIPAVRDLPPR